jgi:hypothetical protein
MAMKSKPVKRKNPAAVALAKLGASKGGKARAEKLSAARRSEIASKAATARMAGLSAARRKEIAREAVLARWSKRK